MRKVLLLCLVIQIPVVLGDTLALKPSASELASCFPLPSEKEISFGPSVKFYLSSDEKLLIDAPWSKGSSQKAKIQWIPSGESGTVIQRAMKAKNHSPTETGVMELCRLRADDHLLTISYERQLSDVSFDHFLILEVAQQKPSTPMETVASGRVIYEADFQLEAPLRPLPLYTKISHQSSTYRVWAYPGHKLHLEVSSFPNLELNEVIQCKPFALSSIAALEDLWKEVAEHFLSVAGGEQGLREKLKGLDGNLPYFYEYPGSSQVMKLRLNCYDKELTNCKFIILPPVHMRETRRTEFSSH